MISLSRLLEQRKRLIFELNAMENLTVEYRPGLTMVSGRARLLLSKLNRIDRDLEERVVEQ